jgi:hypothetical protein
MKNINKTLLEALDFKIGYIEDCFKYPDTLEDDFEFNSLNEKIEYWRYKYLQYSDAREYIQKLLYETT